jgi:hypothetical protein
MLCFKETKATDRDQSNSHVCNKIRDSEMAVPRILLFSIQSSYALFQYFNNSRTPNRLLDPHRSILSCDSIQIQTHDKLNDSPLCVHVC